MSSKTEKICLTVIRWGSYLILFLPLLVYRLTLYPYIFGKIIGFRILVEIIAAAWLFLVVYYHNYRPDFRNPLILCLTIFMGILVLTMLTGVDIHRSFWSSQERMTGVLTMLHFWLWFIILISTFGGSKRGLTRKNTRISADNISVNQRKYQRESAYSRESENDWKEWRRLILASLICSFLVGLYGLGQKIGLQFLLRAEDIRMSATLGNPIFLGVYSMLHIFLAGFLFFREKKWLWRIILLFLLIFNLIIMLLAASRGVMVALGLSLLLFVIYLTFTLPSRKIKLILIPILIILTLAIISGVIFLQSQVDKPWIGKAPLFIRRIAQLTISAEQRTIPWQIGWQGFRQKPILGWGWENFNVIFNKYYQAKVLRWGEEGSWFDRSHNQIIDLLSLTGIFGVGAYLALFGAIFWSLLRKRKNNPNLRMYPNATNKPYEITKKFQKSEKIGLAILASMFLAYFIQNLTVFDTPAPLIVFYLGLGLTYFLTSTNNESFTNLQITNKKQASKIPEEEQAPYRAGKHPESNKFPLPILVFLIIIFLPWMIYKFNLEPFQQSQLGIKAISISQINFEKGLNWYKKALAKPVFTNPEIRLQLAKTISEQQSKANPILFKQGLDFAISEMEKNTQEHPLDARYWLYLGQLYNLGADFGPAYAQKAEEALQQALKLSPQRQQIYFELSRAKIIQEKYDEAIELMEKAVALDEQVLESHHNLGLVYLFVGRTEEGLKKLEKTYYGTDPQKLLYIANAYAKLKNYQQAINLCNSALKYEPKNITAMGQKIIYENKLGQKEAVEKDLKQLFELNPDMAEQIRQIIETELK